MSSLVSTATPWTNDEAPKKRVSTIRKTIRAKPLTEESSVGSSSEYVPSENAKLYSMPSISDVQQETEDRNARVNHIINQMSAAAGENDGAKMADFRPPPQPELTKTKHMNAPQFQWKGDEDESLPDQVNDMQQPVQRFHQQGQGQTQSQKHRFVPIYPTQPSYGNYHMSYVPPANHVANHGAANVLNDSKKDSKLMEKINYMIHLLETQEAEKTANITEEFVLYTFLGVFMIFVLDSFARVGKYTR